MLVQTRSFRENILPVPCDVPRPVWSVMIPTYNCAQFLGETLASVLAQDPGPEIMQIAVVDDCSMHDDPQAVVEAVGRGRVSFFRQPFNVGNAGNFNTCLKRAQGKLIHLLHGDDAVRDDFYRTMQRAFETEPAIGAAFCRDIRMNERGHWHTIPDLLQSESGIIANWLEIIGTGQCLQPPAMVVRRDVYEALGGFDQRLDGYAEDWEMWVRIAAHYPVWYEVAPLALYRTRSTSLSGQLLRTGKNGYNIRQAVAINHTHLPISKADQLSHRALENFAFACLRRARRALNAGDRQTTVVQTREALKSSRSAHIVAQAGWVLLTLAWRTLHWNGRSDT